MRNIFFRTKEKETVPPLLNELQEALERWETAKIGFDWANSEYTDYAIHKLNASEHMFTTLLREAKKDGLEAWPPGVDGLFSGPPGIPLTESVEVTKTSDTAKASDTTEVSDIHRE